jgi:hypothetical protein
MYSPKVSADEDGLVHLFMKFMPEPDLAKALVAQLDASKWKNQTTMEPFFTELYTLLREMYDRSRSIIDHSQLLKLPLVGQSLHPGNRKGLSAVQIDSTEEKELCSMIALLGPTKFDNTAGRGGCYSQAISGTCKLGGPPTCKYQHDKLSLENTCVEIFKRAMASPYFPASMNKVCKDNVPPYTPKASDVRPAGGAYRRTNDRSVKLLVRETLESQQDDDDEDDPYASPPDSPQATPINTIPDLASIVGKLLFAMGPTPVHREAYLCNTIRVPTLLDTGAAAASYISKQCYEDNEDELVQYWRPCVSSAILADGQTRALVSGRLSQVLLVYHDFQQEFRVMIDLEILDTVSQVKVIVGWPDLITTLYTYFRMIQDRAAQEALERTPDNNHNLVAISASIPASDHLPGDVFVPWSNPLIEDAPEDPDVPCSCSAILTHLSMSYEDAKLEYRALLDTHITPELISACPDIMEYFLSEETMSVFVKEKWEGIKGIPPVDLQLKEGAPTSIKPAARNINPRIFAKAESEWDRLNGYFYRPSTSEIASPLVIAPKGKDDVRFCGDYVLINKWLEHSAHYIPNVRTSLEKAQRFCIFADVDVANAFHNFPLTRRTSAFLAVRTHWGLVEPIFMPEGIAPASGILQRTMSDVFKDFDDWTIVIFDNILIMANTYEELYSHLKLFFDKCKEINLNLKMKKSWIGIREANFFGYVITAGTIRMSEDRKAEVAAIPFDPRVKSMQRIMGVFLFFRDFIPHYATLAAPLYDLIGSKFKWDECHDKNKYVAAFEKIKEALARSLTLNLPDYSLDWILRCDASDVACGAVLVQVLPPDTQGVVREAPIAFYSKKWSKSARNWDPMKKECGAIYMAVRHLSYYLLGKRFCVETDHSNILYLEQSQVPILIRMLIYLQSFDMLIRHIKGKTNIVADALSRMYVDGPEDEPISLLCSMTVDYKTKLDAVHRDSNMHPGVARTWAALNKEFPGHRIPHKVVEEYVEECDLCQKMRSRMSGTLVPLSRNVKPLHHRSAIGIDRLAVSPTDIEGHTNIIIIVDKFSKRVTLKPVNTYTAESLGIALCCFFAYNGLYDEVYSDPGSDFTSEAIAYVHKWFNIKHKIGLVDRHESNVEPYCGNVKRALCVFTADRRLEKRWGTEIVISLISWALNDVVHTQTGISPFVATFGSEAGTYMRMPANLPPDGITPAFVKLLDDDLKTIRELSNTAQLAAIAKRAVLTDPALQNQFQVGDYVLFQRNPLVPREPKISAPFLGPFAVAAPQVTNTVQCRNLITSEVKPFHVTRLKIFHGSDSQAFNMAKLDDDQHMVVAIRGHCGDPRIRTTMEFLVEFMDGDPVFVRFSKDIQATAAYEKYCQTQPFLRVLNLPAALVPAHINGYNRLPITAVRPLEKVYMDLRHDASWFYSLDAVLPDLYVQQYVVILEYTAWFNARHTCISATCPVFDEVFPRLDGYFIFAYGSNKIQPPGSVLVDAAFVLSHPDILPEERRASLLAHNSLALSHLDY